MWEEIIENGSSTEKSSQHAYPASDPKSIKAILGGAKYTREWNAFERGRRLNYLLQDINKRIEWGFIADSYINISHGVLWSVETGRIDAIVLGWLHGCTVNELLALLGEIHSHCTTMLEVVAYLNKIRAQVEYKGCGSDMYPIYKRVKSAKKVVE